MNSEERIVTWLISLGVLNSPKKIIGDPEQFLKASLKDGVVLCKLVNRLLPGSVEKYCLEPKNEADCISNIQEFLKVCATLKVELFDARDLYAGGNFSKVLNTLAAVNKATEDRKMQVLTSRSPADPLLLLVSQLPEKPMNSNSSSVHLRKRPLVGPLNEKPFGGQFRRSLWANGMLVQNAEDFVLALNAIAHPDQCIFVKPTCMVTSWMQLWKEMVENGSYQLVVKARFNFKQTNEDELSVNKGDIIYVTRVEEGGWWEGTLNGKTGWFPSNYVKEIKSADKPLSPKALKGHESPQLTKNYYTVVLQSILETERDYAKELQSLLGIYLRPLQSYDKLSVVDIASLLGNVEEICSFQQTLNQALEECAKLPENQQRVGGCFMNLMPQFRSLYLTYCANHPSAVNVLTQHSDELEKFMENQGASNPGILILTTSLSKPFMRLDKYVTLLQELERHMEEAHPDHEDVLKAFTSFKSLVEKEERYFMLFSNVLLMLSASPRMTGFIYQIILMTLTKLEGTEGTEHAFEITGNMIERITVSCNSSQDLHEWLDHLQRLTKGTCSTISKTQSWSAHSTFSSTGQLRGPLEPPKILKAWTLSCLRPAPPLRPSAALGYKEDSSKSPKTMKKFLPKRKTERKASDEEFVIRKSTAALEEDAQILKVIEAYCTGAGFQQTLSSGSRKDSIPQVLLPEEEKIIIEETRSNGQTVTEEKSLVDTVYALKDQVKELKQESKKMKQCLEEELKSRKDLEKLVRRLLKQTDECARDETGRKSSVLA
ncbi:Rho guanine nucleotide exchange factor 6 [Chelonia mydas]|uniref:Rho guanine nucleotide exchange factor 6 n=1 Tax=Chelonia mydas TaxID=8469 RepID=M7AQ98_CHEMY|nr:Rho guanine nucleotide exchange factor 6 [Chelonia mydas]